MSKHTTESMRLFFALWPDDATRTSLMQLQAPMQGRKVPYNNLHLTLAFLGQQPIAVLPQLKDMLARLSPAEFVLTLDKVGYFPRNRIAWVGPHQTPDGLMSLYQTLCAALAESGIVFTPPSSFKAHVTLVRDASLPADMVFDPITWHADEVALVQSITGPGGSEYRVLASRTLTDAVRVPGEVIGEQMSGAPLR